MRKRRWGNIKKNIQNTYTFIYKIKLITSNK